MALLAGTPVLEGYFDIYNWRGHLSYYIGRNYFLSTYNE